MHHLERSLKQEIVYTCIRLAISLSEGNTNHIGHNCWNAFLGVLNSSIQTYINHMNHNYCQGNFLFIIFTFSYSISKSFQTFYKYNHTIKYISHEKFVVYVKFYVNVQFIILNISSSAEIYQKDIDDKIGGNDQLSAK